MAHLRLAAYPGLAHRGLGRPRKTTDRAGARHYRRVGQRFRPELQAGKREDAATGAEWTPARHIAPTEAVRPFTFRDSPRRARPLIFEGLSWAATAGSVPGPSRRSRNSHAAERRPAGPRAADVHRPGWAGPG